MASSPGVTGPQHGLRSPFLARNLRYTARQPRSRIVVVMDPRIVDTELAQWEAWRESTTVRHAAAVSRLLASRPELRGVSPLADTVEESIRWAV